MRKVVNIVRRGLWCAGAVLTGLATASGQVRLPEIEGPIRVTAESFPMMAADRFVDPVDLDTFGYVEEEFFVSGAANAYNWDSGVGLSVLGGSPYSTRVLVRRPADGQRFSGNVIVELPNTARRYDAAFVWSLSWEHLVREGDVWVGVTFLPEVVQALKAFDPDRYAPLAFGAGEGPNPCAEGGRGFDLAESLRWDMISQVGAALRETAPGPDAFFPAGFAVERVYAASHQTDLQTYVDAFHSEARLEGGGPVFDGYVLHRDRGPARIHRCAAAPVGAGAIDVPVIRIVAEGDVLTTTARRRPDSDAPEDRYRLYEVAGAPHADAYFYRHMPALEDQEAVGTEPFLRIWPFDYSCTPEIPLTESGAMRFIANAAFEHLDRWVREGVAPPRGERIVVRDAGPGAEIDRDAFGNAIGGVRSPQMEVPIGTYSPKSPGPGACGNLLHVEPFGWSRLEASYGSFSNYREQLTDAVDRLENQGWLVPADAEQIRQGGEVR
jgi:hypothetical protein